ncbi:hypothetical protein GJ496_004709 [Pomphorhynchus laevis]|nr:hypothetical protein GJ496_004709 [Pomphorhynchus laevis]
MATIDRACEATSRYIHISCNNSRRDSINSNQSQSSQRNEKNITDYINDIGDDLSAQNQQQQFCDVLKGLCGNVVDILNPSSNEDHRKLNTIVSLFKELIDNQNFTNIPAILNKHSDALSTAQCHPLPNTVGNLTNHNSYQFDTITIRRHHKKEEYTPLAVASCEIDKIATNADNLEIKVNKQSRMLRNLIRILQQRSSSIDSHSSKRNTVLGNSSNEHNSYDGSSKRQQNGHIEQCSENNTQHLQSSTTRRRRKIITEAMYSQRKQHQVNVENEQAKSPKCNRRNIIAKQQLRSNGPHINEEVSKCAERSAIKILYSQDTQSTAFAMEPLNLLLNKDMKTTSNRSQSNSRSSRKNNSTECLPTKCSVDDRNETRSHSGSSKGQVKPNKQNINNTYTTYANSSGYVCGNSHDNRELNFDVQSSTEKVLYYQSTVEPCKPWDIRNVSTSSRRHTNLLRRGTDELQIELQCPLCSSVFKNSDRRLYNQHVASHLPILDENKVQKAVFRSDYGNQIKISNLNKNQFRNN